MEETESKERIKGQVLFELVDSSLRPLMTKALGKQKSFWGKQWHIQYWVEGSSNYIRVVDGNNTDDWNYIYIGTKEIHVYDPRMYDVLLKFGNDNNFKEIRKCWKLERN